MKDLVASASPRWRELRLNSDELRTIPISSLSIAKGGVRNEQGIIEFPWIEYHPVVMRIEKLLYELNVIQGDWIEWLKTTGRENAMNREHIAAGSLEDTVLLLTAVFRSERFWSGAVSTSLENGALLAAIDRLLELVSR